ncbi:MAG TPA: ABC transporter transmembrane domain-containing protein [Rhodocyclaceae bacterium]|nr:ABC transporter transmembrane domain-containing protein [Rhodocyclaceae bacterium]
MTSEHSSRTLYLRLLAYVRPYWGMFLLALLAMGLSSIMEPLFPALMKYLLDEGFSQARGGWDWLVYPLAILGIFVGRALFGFVGDYAMAWVSNNVILDLRQAMFERMLELPTRYFGENLSGRLMSRIAHDVGGVAASTTTALTSMVKDSLSILGLMLWLFYLNWKLTLVTVAMIPFIAVAVRAFSGRLRRVARGQQESQGQLTQVLQEAIEGYKVVKIFGGQRYEQERFHTAIRTQRRFNMRGTVAAAGWRMG